MSPVPFSEAVRVWLRVAALSFGGPAGQIAVMHRIVVEEKRWVGEQRFLHALSYCMLLPGPEAQQLAVYLGWLMHKTRGGLLAGLLFILPGFVSILALSLIYVTYGETALVSGLFFGLKAAVLALVVQAVKRIGNRALANPVMVAIAVTAFLAIYFFKVPFPLIVVLAGIAGYLGGRAGLPAFGALTGHAADTARSDADRDSVLGESLPEHAQPNLRWSVTISAVLLALWLLPVALLLIILGAENVFSQIAVFFSKLAVVTFGGAYAVLAYAAQQAVENFGWVTAPEMLDGLGMAETTPGPLIMVLQFVGFMGAFRDPGALNPYAAAILASVLATWVTFVPCFMWIFLGAPFIERLRGNRTVAGVFSAITAAVVGVIANLAIWFAQHVIFAHNQPWSRWGLSVDIPDPASIDLAALVLVVAALIAVLRFRINPAAALAGSAAAGLIWTLWTAAA